MFAVNQESLNIRCWLDIPSWNLQKITHILMEHNAHGVYRTMAGDKTQEATYRQKRPHQTEWLIYC